MLCLQPWDNANWWPQRVLLKWEEKCPWWRNELLKEGLKIVVSSQHKILSPCWCVHLPAVVSPLIPPSLGPFASSLTLLGYFQKLAQARVRWRVHMAAMHGQTVGVSAVSRAVTDALWKHTWSSSYVLPSEVLWHPPFDLRDKAAVALKIKEWVGKLLPLTSYMWRGKERKTKHKRCMSLFRWTRTTSFHVGSVDQPSGQSGEERRGSPTTSSSKTDSGEVQQSALSSTGWKLLLKKKNKLLFIYLSVVYLFETRYCFFVFIFQTTFSYFLLVVYDRPGNQI